jgi:hypothetical protein
MTTLSKFLIATTIAVAATSVFANPTKTWKFEPGMAYMYAGPGKMSAMKMADSDKNHKAMMEHATKVSDNTIFFMKNGTLYSASGMLDPTGNFYIP